MAFDLTEFEPCVHTHRDLWQALEFSVGVKPVSPNHGKAVTLAEFESPTWLASVIVWETGELDLDTARKADGWIVNKHYEVDGVDGLNDVFAELATLIREGAVPPSAVTSWL